MKPLVYLDIVHNAAGAIVIDEKRFKEILDEVYEVGYQDGFEKGKNSNYIRPYIAPLQADREWKINSTPTPVTVTTYDNNTNKTQTDTTKANIDYADHNIQIGGWSIPSDGEKVEIHGTIKE